MEKIIYKRTQRDLLNAMLELLEKQSFEEIKMEMIAQEAMVHRSTVYRYYDDKYGLMHDALEMIARELVHLDKSESVFEVIINFMEKYKTIIYHAVYANKSMRVANDFEIILHEVWFDVVENSDNSEFKTRIAQNYPELVAANMLGSFMSVLKTWYLHPEIPREAVLQTVEKLPLMY